MFAFSVYLILQFAALLQLTSAEAEVEVKEINVRRPSWPDWYNSRTCKVGSGCDNPCAKEGMTCCFCDDTKRSYMKACNCCPAGYYCCPWNKLTRLNGPSCCKNGEQCTADGECVVTLRSKALYSKGLCGPRCRPDTKMYITGDNYLRLYLDGREINLQHPDKWQKLDIIHIPSDVCSIAVYGENRHFQAGIMASSLDDTIISNKDWKCVDDISKETHDWTKKNFDDSHWPAAYESDINRPGHTRPPFEEMSRNAYWIWTNNKSSVPSGKKWNRKAFCRYSLCFGH